MLAPQVVKKTSRADCESNAKAMLAKVGLAEKFYAYPDQLSGGQQRCVAITRPLALRPKAMLCAEITSALNPDLVIPAKARIHEVALEN